MEAHNGPQQIKNNTIINLPYPNACVNEFSRNRVVIKSSITNRYGIMRGYSRTGIPAGPSQEHQPSLLMLPTYGTSLIGMVFQITLAFTVFSLTLAWRQLAADQQGCRSYRRIPPLPSNQAQASQTYQGNRLTKT
jgi:hypothetical protein